MKKEGAVRQKLKQVMYRHRKKYMEKNLEPLPSNCSHNRAVKLPLLPGPGQIHVCRYVEEGVWNDKVCDLRFGGEKVARECPFFTCKKTAEELKEAFQSSVRKAIDNQQAMGLLAHRFPDVAALMWVLDQTPEEILGVDEDTEDSGEEDAD